MNGRLDDSVNGSAYPAGCVSVCLCVMLVNVAERLPKKSCTAAVDRKTHICYKSSN